MARLKSGILGKFNDSVGNITGYNLGGQQVIRKKTVDVKDPNTINQQAQRANMLYAIEIYKVLKPMLQFTLRQREKKQTVFSEFLRLNLNYSIVNSTVDLDKLIVAKSNSPEIILSIEYETGINNISRGTLIT
ncbi:MAG: DUF6266 family protein [Bacteroidales bacterium]|nr:DUF6266 family protein [Bacteroidales bacterium]